MEESFQQLLVADKGELLFGADEMPMMITVAVVVAHHPAVISGTKSVIDKSQVVLGDPAARVLPYLFADESCSESTTHLGGFVHNLAQPPGFLPLWIISQIGHHTPYLSPENHHVSTVREARDPYMQVQFATSEVRIRGASDPAWKVRRASSC